MDAPELPPRHAQIARERRSTRQDDGIELALQGLRIHVHADVAVGAKGHPFFAHQPQAALQRALFQLEFRNAVAQQAADAIRALEHGDRVAGAIQLIGRGQPRGSGADDRDALARARRRRLRDDPAFAERALDDRRFRGLDGDRRAVDPEHARPLARRRAQPAGELGEIVRRVQPIDRGAPAIAVHEIVPVGNQVAERTAVMAERKPAIHAPRRLILQRRFRVRQRDLAPVQHALGNRARRRLVPLDFEKAGRLTHGRPADPPAPARARSPTSSRARA